MAVVVALWSAVAPSQSRADLTVYVTGSGNEFGTLDLTTGKFNQIAILNLPTGDFIFGMGHGADGKLYGVDSQPNAHLWQIAANGGLMDLGAIGQSAAGASSDLEGTLFVIGQNLNATYYTLNPPSPTPTVLNPMTKIETAGGLMAVTGDGSQLFATSNTGTTWDLVRIDPADGAVSTVGDTHFTPNTGLFIGKTLYGLDSTSDAIVTLNTMNGAGTQVATYSLPNGDTVFSVASVPEPSSLVLGLLGTVLAAWVVLIRLRRPAAEPCGSAGI
jgi:hypothetical protein